MANKKEVVEQGKQQGITSYLSREDVKKNVMQVLGSEKSTTRFISSIISAVQATPVLAKCTNVSILSAGLQGEALKLAPSPQLGQFYIVPYDNKKKIGNRWETVKEAQFQIGYKGYIQLAIRSGQYRKIVVSEIKAGECEYNPITEDINLHPIMNPGDRENTETIGYYAMFELNNGFKKELFSPKEKVDAHAKKYSSAYRYDLNNHKQGSRWTTDFDAMAKKTLIRELIGKWGIMSVEMQEAYRNDMAVIDEEGNPIYVDNQQDIESKVAVDIDANANTETFQEAEVEESEQEVVEEKVKAEVIQDEEVPDFMK